MSIAPPRCGVCHKFPCDCNRIAGPPISPANLPQLPDMEEIRKMLGVLEEASKWQCDSCKKECNGGAAVEYNPFGVPRNRRDAKSFTRKICYKCHARMLDKLYETGRNVETEELLYEKGTEGSNKRGKEGVPPVLSDPVCSVPSN